MEWPSCSKWTLSRPQGETNSLGPGTREWVRKTLSSTAFTHKDELRAVASLLSAQETSEDARKTKEEVLTHFLNALDNPDLARTLVNAGGMQHIINAMLGSRFTDVRRKAAQVFTTVTQNNPTVQSFAHAQGVLGGLLEAIEKEQDVAAKEAFVSSLSALVRGEFDKARREFVVSGGLEIILDVVLQPVSLRIVKKALLLLVNLFYYAAQVPELRISEKAAQYGFVRVLLSMEIHEDMEVRQMALQALHNLCRCGMTGAQEIAEGLAGWQRRAQTRGDRPDEVATIVEMLRMQPHGRVVS